MLIAGTICQPPRMMSTVLLFAPYFFPLPNGSSKIGAMMTRCGTSRRL
jgi:hypothetical protein